MRLSSSYILASVFLVSGCTFSLPKDLVALSPQDPCPSWTLDELTQRSRGFDHATDTFTLECALGTLRVAAPAPIHATEAGARITFLLADRAVTDAGRQEKLAAEGVRWAEIALGEGGKGDGGASGAVHYYLAVNLGLAIQSHIALALKNLSRLGAELEQACALAPDEDLGGPYRVLGMLYFRAPPWPQGIGDEEKALKLLSKAAKKYPGHPLNHLFLAKVLWSVEEEDALPRVERHLIQAYQLIQNGSWGEAGPRWQRELTEFAAEAELTLPANPPGATN